MNRMKYEFLESVRDEIDKCVKCAACHADCPTYERSFSETLSARGKIRLAKGILEGSIGLSKRVAKDFSLCLSCLNCSAVCPPGVDTLKIFTAVRSHVYEKKERGRIESFIHEQVLPYPKRLNILAKLTGASSLLYRMAPRMIARYFPYAPDGKARVTPPLLQSGLRSRLKEVNKPRDGKTVRRVAYFSGCMTDLAYPDTGVHVAEQLNSAGVEVVFPEEQVCCGAPAYFAGDMETTRKLAMKNIEAFRNLNVDAIVISCATCGSVLKHAYPQILPDDNGAKEMADKVVDFQSLLVELEAEKKFKADDYSDEKLKVTYHDPCHLKRGLGVSEEPRLILKNLPGVQFVEMENADSCCGGSGAFGLEYYEMSMDIGKAKANAIKKSGASVVVTSCPMCQLTLADALNRQGYDIEVKHTADLIDQVLSTRK
ncbi:Glycolate dehydrogenase, iron-sulfur subunit GlcF [hydrothermal vent metagenome]|uniref:Glycolate dehydrogenase, iron-sulfur subunit GlcF n=1 Tax=hydrothermal vent metagenome TaxID=652676 RepID=A0A3B1C405_9ZZZZ